MRTDILEKKDDILNLIEKNESKALICKKLNCKPITLDRYLKILGIVYVGNKGRKNRPHIEQRKNSSYYLNSEKFINSHKLRLKLIEDGIKEYKCECCNLSEWLGEKIPLELHHMDGNKSNNKLNNLQILCPNCHSKTDTFRSKNIKAD